MLHGRVRLELLSAVFWRPPPLDSHVSKLFLPNKLLLLTMAPRLPPNQKEADDDRPLPRQRCPGVQVICLDDLNFKRLRLRTG